MRHMKFVIIATAALVVLGVAWLYFSPYLALKAMKKAALEGNAEDLAEYVDFPSVRESIKGAMMGGVMRKMEGQKKKAAGDDDPFDALGVVMAEAMIGPMVDAIVSPTGMAALFKKRSSDKDTVGGTSKKQSEEATAHDLDNLRMGYEGFSKFVVYGVQQDQLSFRDLVLKREGLAWKLSGIRFVPAAYVCNDNAAKLTVKQDKSSREAFVSAVITIDDMQDAAALEIQSPDSLIGKRSADLIPYRKKVFADGKALDGEDATKGIEFVFFYDNARDNAWMGIILDDRVAIELHGCIPTVPGPRPKASPSSVASQVVSVSPQSSVATQSEKVNESAGNEPKLQQTTSFDPVSFVPASREGYEYFERITIDGMSIEFPKSEKQQAAMLKVVEVTPVQWKHGVNYSFAVKPDKVALGKDYKAICESEIMGVSLHDGGDGNFDSLSFRDKDGQCGDDLAIKPFEAPK